MAAVLPALMLLGNAGCITPPDGEASETRHSAITSPSLTFNLSVQTPKGMSPTDVTLSATGSVVIGGATTITRAGTTKAKITNIGNGGVRAEPDAVLGDVLSTSTVTLRDRVRVLGTVFAPNVVRGNAVTIAGGADADCTTQKCNVQGLCRDNGLLCNNDAECPNSHDCVRRCKLSGLGGPCSHDPEDCLTGLSCPGPNSFCCVDSGFLCNKNTDCCTGLCQNGVCAVPGPE